MGLCSCTSGPVERDAQLIGDVGPPIFQAGSAARAAREQQVRLRRGRSGSGMIRSLHVFWQMARVESDHPVWHRLGTSRAGQAAVVKVVRPWGAPPCPPRPWPAPLAGGSTAGAMISSGRSCVRALHVLKGSLRTARSEGETVRGANARRLPRTACEHIPHLRW
jgi:hypothetical protein